MSSDDEPTEQEPLLRASGQDRSWSLSQQLRQTKYRRQLAGVAILLTLTLERLAFYSLTGNLYLYLNGNPLNWLPYSAMDASYVFTGVAYLVALVGGWLADSLIGKFRTILLGLGLYGIGYSALVYISSKGPSVVPDICFLNTDVVPFSNVTNGTSPEELVLLNLYAIDPNASPPLVDYLPSLQPQSVVNNYPLASPAAPETCSWLIYLLLVVIGLAVGTIRANIAPFGADQYKHASPESMRRFFNWYYWCVNTGAFVSLGAIAYIQQAMPNGFYYGYLVSAICLGVAIVLFCLGRPWYIVRKPGGSVLINVLRIMQEAYRSRRRHRARQQMLDRQRSDDSIAPTETAFEFEGYPQPTWLDMAKVRYGGSFHESTVDDIKSLGNILIVFAALIPYWIVYFQMQTSFIAQGLHMKLNPYAHHYINGTTANSTNPDMNFSIPAAWLTLFDVIFLIILIPVMDRFVYPFLDRRHIHLSVLFKISLGMVFSLSSVVVAGGVEFYRLHLINSEEGALIVQVIGNTSYLAADMWIFWQVPQYALIGVSEVFASVASIEFAYMQAPKSMQGIIMGLHCFCTGVGSFLGTGLLELVRPYWFGGGHKSSLNDSHLDYYFFLLAGIQLIAMLGFIFVSKHCRIEFGDQRTMLSCDQPSTQQPIGESSDTFRRQRR